MKTNSTHPVDYEAVLAEEKKKAEAAPTTEEKTPTRSRRKAATANE